MGVTIIDGAGDGSQLHVNWWNWQPTVVLIDRFAGDLDPDQRFRMTFSGGGGGLTREQARNVASALQSEVLPGLQVDEEIGLRLNLLRRTEPSKLHRESPDQNYGATKEWLETFAAFCSICDGFAVF